MVAPATTVGVGLVTLGAAGTVLWVEGVITSATEYGVTVFATGRSFLAVVGTMLTLTAGAGAPLLTAADVELPPVTPVMPGPLFAGAVVTVATAGAWVRGTAPLPGVPIPGNTVPC